MSSFKFIHAADVHLDSPMAGLSRYAEAPFDDIVMSPRRAFSNLIDLAIKEEVDFLLIAGDLFDGDTKTWESAEFVNSEFIRLGEAGIRAFLIYGNHDAGSIVKKRLSLPDNCTTFPVDAADTVHLEDLGVAIHGQSYPDRAVPENLAEDYPKPVGGAFNIGILHTSAEGNPNHGTYAPCSVTELVNAGYHYWALGHIHIRQVLSESPMVLFPGNLQGRSIRETGAKGASIVEVVNGSLESIEHRDLDIGRWFVLEVDVSDLETAEEVVDRVAEEMKELSDREGVEWLAVRVVITGQTAAHADLIADREGLIASIRSRGMEATRRRAWIEKVKVQTRSAIDIEEVRRRSDAIGVLLRETEDPDESLGGEIAGSLEGLSKKIPHDIRAGDPNKGVEGFDPADAEALNALIPEVEQIVLGKISEEQEG